MIHWPPFENGITGADLESTYDVNTKNKGSNFLNNKSNKYTSLQKIYIKLLNIFIIYLLCWKNPSSIALYDF